MSRVRQGLILLGVGIMSTACADLVTDILEYGSVEVTAVRRNGEPVEGAELLLYVGQGVRGLGTTDAQGTYRFDQVPPNIYGVYAEPPEGYARPEELLGGPSTAQVDGLPVDADNTPSVSFTYLKKGPGRIIITALEPSGTPVPDAMVSVFSPTGTLAEFPAGTSGQVDFTEVPYGQWGARVAPPEVYLAEGETVFETDGLIIEEGSEETIAFVLEKCLGTLRVRVQTPAGSPVADFPVRLYQGSGTLEEGTTTSNGEKAFSPLLCRTFGVGINPLRGWEFEDGPGTGWQDALKVVRGSDETVSFTVESCAGVIQLRTRTGTGAPLAGSTLTLYAGPDDLSETVTAADGTGTLHPEECTEQGVRFTPPGGYTVTWGRGTSFYDGLSFRGGANLALDFTAQACVGDVQVRVQTSAGTPLAGATLTLFTGGGELDRVATGANGRHTFFPGICGTEVGVRVAPPPGYMVVEGRGSSFYDGLRPLPGAPVSVVFILQPS